MGISVGGSLLAGAFAGSLAVLAVKAFPLMVAGVRT